jgi:hypothetical protein
VFIYKTGGVGPLLAPATYGEIFVQEMPKFFGPDTVLWYYPEKPVSGYVFYAIAITATVLATLPFLRAPGKILKAISSGTSDADKDLLMLVLTLACFLPYLIAWKRTPSYFLAGCIFLALLTGRFLARSFATDAILPRIAGAAFLFPLLAVGASVLVNVGRHDEIETLTFNSAGRLHMSRVPGKDLAAVESHLDQTQVSSVWTTVSFVYPLIFESREKLAVSDSLFGTDRRIYPDSVPRRLPRPDQATAFVMETDSPVRASIEAGFAQAKIAIPVATTCGTLTILEARRRSR